MEKFIDYIDRSDDAPLYLEDIKELLNKGIICDHGIVSDIFDLMDDSDARPGIINKLEMVITSRLIIPYLKENGLADIPPSGMMDPEEDEDDPLNSDDNDESEETEE